MSRLITRLLLGFALLLATTVVVAVLSSGPKDFYSLALALAAALSVVTAVVSSWNSQRVVELEEDRLQPYPYPRFDFGSRYMLTLLRLENLGGSVAYDIELLWDSDPPSVERREFGFSETLGNKVPVLLPGQSISLSLGTHVQLFAEEGLHRYCGSVRFKDGAGRTRTHPFVIDAEVMKNTPVHTEEDLRTSYDLQKIPGEIGKLTKELATIRRRLDRRDEDDA